MKWSNFTYLMKQGLQSLWKNKLMSVASVAVLTICLVLVGGAVLLSINVNSMVGYVEQQNELVAFVKDDASEEQILAVQKQVQQMENVDSVVYTSKEEAYESQKKKMGDIIDGLQGKDVFPASFTVKLKNVDTMQQDENNLMATGLFLKINAPTGLASTLTTVKHIVNIFGTTLVLIMVVVSLVIISNTIRVSVFSRRREINIMKYVGATNLFIRLPFILESAVMGLIAAALSFVTVHVVYAKVLSWLTGNTTDFVYGATQSMIQFGSIGWQLAVCFLVIGVVMGTVGCVLSVRKHLKV